MRGSVLFAALACACGDPLVRVDIDAGPFEGAPIVIRVLAPARTDPITCDDLAFDAVRLDAAIALTERQSQLRDEALSLADLDRASARLVLAEAAAPDGQRGAIGCAELPAGIDTDQTLALRLEPASIGGLLSGAPIEAEIGQEAPIVVMVDDRFGAPLADVPVRWSVTGADGAGTSGVAETGADGRAEIALSLPRAIGPIAVVVRPRFAIGNPPPISGFVGDALAPHPLAPGAFALGRFGETGEFRMVRALGSDLVRCSGDAFDRCAPFSGLAFPPGRLAALARSEPDGADGVVAIGPNAWAIVHPSGAIDEWMTMPPARAPSVLAAGPCGRADALLVQDEAGATAYPRLDAPMPAPFGPDILVLASGCVSTTEGDLVRTYAVFQTAQRIPILIGDLMSPWLGPPTAFAFAYERTSGQRSVMGVQLELNQPVVTRSVWAGGALAPVAVDALPSPPQSVESGDFDGDGALDLASIVIPPTSPDGRCHCDCSLWIALGDHLGGSRSLSSICDPTLFAGDLDADGRDEVILLSGSNAFVVRIGSL